MSVKTEMAMRDNGNYESIISPIQHKCLLSDIFLYCIEYGWDLGKLYLECECGDPYEDGFSFKVEVKYCPACGYHPM